MTKKIIGQQSHLSSRFLIMYHNVLYSDLTLEEKTLYSIIEGFTRQNNLCYPSNEHLALVMSCSHRTVTRAIKQLEGKGYIAVRYESDKNLAFGQRRYLSAIKTPVPVDNSSDTLDNMSIPLENLSSLPRQNVYTPPDKMSIDNINKDNNSNISTPIIPQRGKSLIDIPSEFKDTLELWLQHKKELGKSYKPTGLKQIIKKALELGVERFRIAVEHSISNNYQGIFEPKQENKPKQFLNQYEKHDLITKRIKEKDPSVIQEMENAFGEIGHLFFKKKNKSKEELEQERRRYQAVQERKREVEQLDYNDNLED